MKKLIALLLSVMIMVVGFSFMPISAAGSEISPTDGKLKWIGRTIVTDSGVAVGWGMTEVNFNVKATAVRVKITTGQESPDAPHFAVYVNNKLSKKFKANKGTFVYTVADGLSNKAITNIRLVKTNEVWMAATIEKFEIDGSLQENKQSTTKVIEVVGDSISAGYGILTQSDWQNNDINTDATYGYATKLAGKMKAQLNLIAQSGKGVYMNNDGSTNNTMPMIYNKRLPSINNSSNNHSQTKVSMVLVNLGTNDAFQRAPEAKVSASVISFISHLMLVHPEAQIVWTYGLMNDGMMSTIKNAVEKYPMNDGRVHFIKLPKQSTFSSKPTALQDHPNTEVNTKVADYIYKELQKKGVLDAINNVSKNESSSTDYGAADPLKDNRPKPTGVKDETKENSSSLESTPETPDYGGTDTPAADLGESGSEAVVNTEKEKSFTKLIIFSVIGVVELGLIVAGVIWFIKKKKSI